MKIIASIDKEGNVFSVYSFSYYEEKGKSEEEIIEATKKSNEQAEYERFHIIDIPENLSEVFKFILGDNQYKKTCTLSHLYDRLEDIKDTVETMQRDFYDASEWIGETTREIKKVIDD